MKNPVLPISFGGKPGARSLISAVTFTTLCSASVAGNPFIDVKVYFDGNCPAAVDNWVPIISSIGGAPDKVRWMAYELDGTTQKPSAQYDIYFDPFKGPSLTSVGGTVASTPISSTAPSNVLYKYTILAAGCAPLDPYIRIQ